MATAEFKFDFSEDILHECVMQNYTRIVAGVDPKGEVLNKLFEKFTITMPEKVRIQELPEERRGKALIDRLLSCRRPRAVAELLEILYISEERAYRDIAVEVHTAAQGMVSSAFLHRMELEETQVQRDKTEKHSNPNNQTSASIQSVTIISIILLDVVLIFLEPTQHRQPNSRCDTIRQ